MKKNITKINEAQLRKVVAKSIKKALREDYRDDEPMRAKIPSRVMPSATVAPGNHDLHNPFVLGTKQIRSATDAAQKMNQIVQKFVYEAEEAQEPWTIQSLSQEIFNKFSKINGFEYGKPHVYEFTLDNIQKRIKLYINKVRNNLWYFEEGGNGKIVAESVKSCDDFYNYVIKRFNEEGVEVGDAGDAEELYQGCSNYDYETVPFEQLYQEVKNDWLSYKSEQKQYHGINENALKQIVAESVKKVLTESYEDFYEYIDDNIKKILEHIHGISDTLMKIHETANVKGKDFVNFDDIITTLMMDVTDFRDDVMGMSVKYGLAKGRETL